MSPVRASVLIPTHDHAATLPLTVGSVLAQTVGDLEVLVIGDGVTAECRTAIEELVERDPRVRFLDFPKGPHHGEIYRHEAILSARSDAILYLCDDDLLLPGHVGDLLALLAEVDFVQSRNGYFRADGGVELYPTDLGDRRCVDWHLLLPRRNLTSITGSAHSRDYYLRVGEQWETTPQGEWPDHYQWKKFFRRPDFRGATSHRMTALQFPSHLDGREAWTPQMRFDELVRWAAVVAGPDGQQRIDALVDRATQVALAHAAVSVDLCAEASERARLELDSRLATEERLRASLADRDLVVRRLRRRLRRRTESLEQARAEVAAVRGSASWRLTAPLRALSSRTRRHRA